METTDKTVWEGAPELRIDLVPLDWLTPHPRNPRRGEVDEIVKSLRRFGQTQQVLVDAEGTIIAGNHTFLAARELGWTHIARLTNDFKTPEEAVAYLLADNRIPELGGYDRAEQIALIAELEETGRWDGTGYEPDDLANLRALEEISSAPAPPAAPAAPAVTPVAPPSMREVLLLLSEEQLASFSADLRALRGRYGLEGVTETVLRAVRDEALRIYKGEEGGT